MQEAHREVVEAIADMYAGSFGLDTLKEMDEGVYGFVAEDGMTYRAYMPGTKFPVYEDSGRPDGHIKVLPGFVNVRCITDAPDGWFDIEVEPWMIEYRERKIAREADQREDPFH